LQTELKHTTFKQHVVRILIPPFTPNDPYSGRTASLNSKRYIVYIYSTNIGTEHFKMVYILRFFSSSKCSLFHNSNIFGSCIIHILYTVCAKIKKKKFRRQKVNPLHPSNYFIYHQFNIHKSYVLPTQCIYVPCGSENK